MITVARILLGLAALVTLLVAQLISDAHPVHGADAIGLVVVLLVLVVQWVLLVGPVLIAARRGALAWLHTSNVAQALAALVWLTVAGVTASAAVIMAYGPSSDAMVPWAFALAAGVPALVIAGLAVSVREGSLTTRAARPSRFGAVALTLLVAVGAVRMLRLEFAAEREIQAAIAAQEQEREQFDAARRAAFEALPPTASLRDWLPWLQLSDDTGQRAVAAVRARPTLEQDVAAMLRSDDAPEALRFLWLWMPGQRSALAAPTRDAIAMLPDWAEHSLAAPPPASESPTDPPNPVPTQSPVELTDMAQAAIVIADAYASSGLDFETPITAFSRVLERHALPEERLGEDRTYQPRAFLRTWLEERASRRNDRK